MSRRRIAVVTGSRAEYGLLRGLMQAFQADSDIELLTLVTGMHLSQEFGLTYTSIEADGFRLDAKVEMLLSSDTDVGVAKSLGLGTVGFADALGTLRPDIVVLLGDRFEILAAAQAAMMLRIPIAHLHGGESSEGAIDEAIRHAITKMAHWHFTAAEPYRARVVQLGEAPSRVYNTGAIGLDNLRTLEPLTRPQLEAALGFALTPGPLLLCTYHPATLDADGTNGFAPLFEAFDRRPSWRVVFTKSNADAGGRAFNAAIDAYVAERTDRCAAFTSLGLTRYLSLLLEADVCVGNSSSGIIEAPTARVPTVNIGARQNGRLKAASILDCGPMADEIVRTIEHALSDEFARVVANGVTLYGSGDAAARIHGILRDVPLEGVLNKRFHDLHGAASRS